MALEDVRSVVTTTQGRISVEKWCGLSHIDNLPIERRRVVVCFPGGRTVTPFLQQDRDAELSRIADMLVRDCPVTFERKPDRIAMAVCEFTMQVGPTEKHGNYYNNPIHFLQFRLVRPYVTK